jgi:hypothetical protein
MKRAGRATIFEIGDMIGMPGNETSALMPTAYGTERSLYVLWPRISGVLA